MSASQPMQLPSQETEQQQNTLSLSKLQLNVASPPPIRQTVHAKPALPSNINEACLWADAEYKNRYPTPLPRIALPNAPKDSIMRSNGRLTDQEIHTFRTLLERCLQLYMNQTEVGTALQFQATVDPGFTNLVWQKLEADNPEFFKSYHIRLRIKEQITAFNYLVSQQAQILQKSGYFSPQTSPSPAAAHPHSHGISQAPPTPPPGPLASPFGPPPTMPPATVTNTSSGSPTPNPFASTPPPPPPVVAAQPVRPLPQTAPIPLTVASTTPAPVTATSPTKGKTKPPAKSAKQAKVAAKKAAPAKSATPLMPTPSASVPVPAKQAKPPAQVPPPPPPSAPYPTTAAAPMQPTAARPQSRPLTIGNMTVSNVNMNMNPINFTVNLHGSAGGSGNATPGLTPLSNPFATAPPPASSAALSSSPSSTTDMDTNVFFST